MLIKPENVEAALRMEFKNMGGRRRNSRGPLHDKITMFLPDFVDQGDTCCNLQRLAIALGMTPQGVYKFFRRPNRENNQIALKVVKALVELSSLTKNKTPDFRPATAQDFWDFISI